jgi:hypothetical protein
LNVYEGASIVFKTENEDIHMRKGVQQGDPLSPLLFNIAMDPMLAAIMIVELKIMLGKVDKASLKPRQKLIMAYQFVPPRLNYPLTEDAYPKGVLKDLDRLLRSYERKWLKLSESSPNTFF